MSGNYQKLEAGKSFHMRTTNVLKLKCCDCGLVHRIAIMPKRGGWIELAFERDNRCTAAGRRKRKRR